MTHSSKFLFDLNNFDAPEEEDILEDIEDIEPPAPTFSEEELETAKAIAHAAGRNEGLQEERERREQFVADTLKRIADSFSTLFAAEMYRERQYEEEALRLALQIIETIAPSLNNRLGQEALKGALKTVLKSQSEHSEIIIEVHPDTASDIDKLVESLWPDKDNAPRYKILADSNLEKGACKLSWKDGGMVRNPSKMTNDIKTAIESLLVEQVMGTGNSSLTVKENNVIKDKQQEDSASEQPETEENGDDHE